MNKCTARKVSELVFENKKNLSDGFYIEFMRLIKEYYYNGNNVEVIRIFLKSNKNEFTEQILLYFPEPSYFDNALNIISFIPYIF